MNDTHVLEEQHREDAGSLWWDGELQGLAQRSGSAGNSNHNHVQCTSHAYNYTLSSPPSPPQTTRQPHTPRSNCTLMCVL